MHSLVCHCQVDGCRDLLYPFLVKVLIYSLSLTPQDCGAHLKPIQKGLAIGGLRRGLACATRATHTLYSHSARPGAASCSTCNTIACAFQCRLSYDNVPIQVVETQEGRVRVVPHRYSKWEACIAWGLHTLWHVGFTAVCKLCFDGITTSAGFKFILRLL